MTKLQIKKQYLSDVLSLNEACMLLMEKFDLYRGEALEYLMR